jgi:hypothetical protein
LWMAVQQCHVLVLHRHWMVVGSRWLPTVPVTPTPQGLALTALTQNASSTQYSELSN